MRNFTVLLTLSLTLLCFSTTSESKSSCTKHLNKLHLIQAKQRLGHSLPRSNTLNQQEAKTRNLWWQCENSPAKNKKSPKKYLAKTKNKKQAIQQTTLKHNSSLLTHKYQRQKSNTPFKSSSAIVIKEKFAGKKKYAWLKYYRQPDQCIKPKTLAIFAFCVEDRQTQQGYFEKIYQHHQ